MMNDDNFSTISLQRIQLAVIPAAAIAITPLTCFINQNFDEVQLLCAVVRYRVWDPTAGLNLSVDSSDIVLTPANNLMVSGENPACLTSLQTVAGYPLLHGWQPLNLFIQKRNDTAMNTFVLSGMLYFNILPTNAIDVFFDAMFYYRFRTKNTSQGN